MERAGDALVCLLVVALFGLLFFLRTRFPNASKAAETAVLIGATALFLALCNRFFGAAL